MHIEKLLEDLNSVLEQDVNVEIDLRDSLAEEEVAISAYLKRAKEAEQIGNEKLAKLYNELADDEKVHAASLKQALIELGFEDAQLEIDGAEEFVDITEEE